MPNRTNGRGPKAVADAGPPHDLVAERKVIVACFDDPAAVAAAGEILSPADFYDATHRKYFQGLLELGALDVPRDPEQLAVLLAEHGEALDQHSIDHLVELRDTHPADVLWRRAAERVRALAANRRELASAQELAAALRIGDDERADRARAELRTSKPATTDPFAEHWVQLASRPELLTEQPPRQTWLLTRYAEGRDVGVIPRGRTGLLTGAGGVAKTFTAIQLAMAVARGVGSFWLESFRVATSGHVLLGLGEEDLEEAQRRFWRAANAAEVSPVERAELAERIDVLPLHGVPVGLMHSPERGVVVATQAADALRARLERRGVEWALIVLDPLSRWAGAGVETDNEVATRFAQVVESLCSVPGDPFVLLTHHSSAASAERGDSNARGVTGIRDAFRWQASLDAIRTEEGDRAVRLRCKKSNYAPEFDDVLLVRRDDAGAEGTLRPAKPDEAEPFTRDVAAARAVERSERSRARVAGDTEAVLAAIVASPGITLRNLYSALRAAHGSFSRDRTDAALVALGTRVRRETGQRRAEHFFPGDPT